MSFSGMSLRKGIAFSGKVFCRLVDGVTRRCLVWQNYCIPTLGWNWLLEKERGNNKRRQKDKTEDSLLPGVTSSDPSPHTPASVHLLEKKKEREGKRREERKKGKKQRNGGKEKGKKAKRKKEKGKGREERDSDKGAECFWSQNPWLTEETNRYKQGKSAIHSHYRSEFHTLRLNTGCLGTIEPECLGVGISGSIHSFNSIY